MNKALLEEIEAANNPADYTRVPLALLEHTLDVVERLSIASPYNLPHKLDGDAKFVIAQLRASISNPSN